MRFRKPGCILLSLVIVLGATAAQAGSSWSVLDIPGVTKTNVSAINRSNVILGFFDSADGKEHGFLRAPDGTITQIDEPDARSYTTPSTLNENGDVVGQCLISGKTKGFIRDANGTYVSINIAGANVTSASDINDDGVVVGYALTASNSLGFVRAADGTITTFSVRNATDTTAFAINRRGVILGNFEDAGGVEHGFLRGRGGKITAFDVPGADSTGAGSINDAGQVIGVYTTGGAIPVYHGYLRTPDGSFTTIDVSGPEFAAAKWTFPVDINAKGEIVGFFTDTSGIRHGFVRTTDGTCVRLDAPGATETLPAMIAANDKIVGNYDNNHAFRLNGAGWRN
ncbi:MAG TPA: hypothetical protein VMF58_04170 [Rhizomicrobium sp.]|nr:hypothetical protein [Rhizomicrobium sp.]